MLKKYVIVIGLFLFSLSSQVWAGPPPISARIWGTLTIIEMTQITKDNCDSLTSSLCNYTYIIEVKHADGTSFSPKAKTFNLTSSGYIIDIPIYEQESQPEGAIPGEMAVIHVYENGHELTVKTPPKGHIIVGNSADVSNIDLVLQKNSDLSTPNGKIYTQEELNSERQKWDANNDLKVSLEDAIHALQIISGIRNQAAE